MLSQLSSITFHNNKDNEYNSGQLTKSCPMLSPLSSYIFYNNKDNKYNSGQLTKSCFMLSQLSSSPKNGGRKKAQKVRHLS